MMRKWICMMILLKMINGYLLPFWYPLIPTRILEKKKIHDVIFNEMPMVCYKDKNNSYILHSDICPHQGASFGKKGFINEEGNLQCGYHGFEFCNGRFCKIPNPLIDPKPFNSKIFLPLYETKKNDDFLFFQPSILKSTIDIIDPYIFYPPEEYDENFKSTEGFQIIDNNYMSVCENLLDMLHISYVHSFGNRNSPLPYNIRSYRLNESSFRTQFNYIPNENTISKKIGNTPKVVVQNEYHLPSNTITRVVANKIIKTVFTRSVPISLNKTLLYWKIYRNFWLDPFFPIFNTIGDVFIDFLMKKTIKEDIDILKNVYDQHRDGLLTVKYDITISNFRKDTKKFIDKFNLSLSN